MNMKLDTKIIKMLFDEITEYDFDIEQQGVYLIGDYYIGKSFDIKERIVTHIYKTFNFKFTNVHKEEKILNDFLTNGKIKVTLLSKNQDDEIELIEKYCNTLPLTNIKDNPNKDNDDFKTIYFKYKSKIQESFNYEKATECIIDKLKELKLLDNNVISRLKNEYHKNLRGNRKKQRDIRLKKIKKEHKNRLLFMEALEKKEDMNTSIYYLLQDNF